MKIGIDVTPMFRKRGGIGWYTFHLTSWLTRIDHDNTYVLYRDTSSQYPDDPVRQANVTSVVVPKVLLRWRVKNDGIEVFHGTNYKLPARGRCGSVVTVHDLALDRFPQFSKKLFGQRLAAWRSRRVLRSADRIIAVSRCTASDVEQYYRIPQDRIDVIPLGVGFDGLHRETVCSLESLTTRYGIQGNHYILHVGGGDPRKNLSTLLAAYRLVRIRRKGYPLVLAGAMGRWRTQLEHTARRLNLLDALVFTGYVPPSDLVALYTHAAVFVFPSLYEGFGIPPLEAMACGTPVITSNSGALPETVGDAAMMVDPLNARGIAEMITMVLDDPSLRAALKQKGEERAGRFSWEQTARKTLAVYEKVARGTHAGSAE